MRTIWIKAAPWRGKAKRRVRVEGARDRWHVEDRVDGVLETAYYLRRLASGELLEVAPPAPVAVDPAEESEE
jgi:hypothetical protein